ncbi:MAG TPA: DUF1178 family protein [Beijerinckiaceae bacterium]|nr:DUF1178 family protein [Beijerinckiaceae bacterium]
MIRYALACEAGHGFDSWFRSSEDFDAQCARGLVACPYCHSTTIAKQVMAPIVARSDRGEPAAPAPLALIDDKAAELRRRIAELRTYVAENCENVGPRFAEEARRIHYGESETRSICGEASREDAAALIDEGVPILPVPVLPDDRN